MPNYAASAPATAPAPTDPTVPLPPGGHWPASSHPHRRLYAASVILGFAGLTTLVVYITSADEMSAIASTLLAVLLATLIALAGVALMLGYSVQTRGDRDQALHTRICTATASVREDLDALGRSAALLEHLGEQSRAARGEVAALGEQLGSQLVGLDQRVGTLLEAVTALQQRQDELEDKMDQAATAESIVASMTGNGHGQVRPLYPSNGAPDQRHPR